MRISIKCSLNALQLSHISNSADNQSRIQYTISPLKMKSQEAAFRDARKPQPKPKIQQPVVKAAPNKIAKNAARNERRKAARKVKSMLKESGAAVNSKKSVPAKAEAASGDESEDGGVKLDEEME